MKKLILIGITVGIASLAQATTVSTTTYTVNAPSTIVGTGALNGANAYEWGISGISLAANQTISGATLQFTGLQLQISGNGNNVWASLLNLNNTGLTTISDGDAVGDYFNGGISSSLYKSLGSSITFNSNLTTPAQTWTIDFANITGALSVLNTDAADGIFDIGIDPDCHFTDTGITFTYTVSTTSVPDTATTMLLLGTSMLGLEIFRRKFVPAKNQA